MACSRFARRTPAGALLAAALLSGCATVGPDYAGPPPVGTASAARGAFAGAPAPAASATPPAQWWQSFGDSTLSALIELALTANPSVHAAQARLRQARAALSATVADGGPGGGATAQYQRYRPSFAQFGIDSPQLVARTVDLFDANLDASWELDLFGGQRRAREAAAGQLEAADADLAAMRVSIAAEVALAYIGLRSQQGRIGILGQAADMDAQLIDLTGRRRSEGTASDLDVERIATHREAVLAELADARAELAAERNRLAVLTGREPALLDGQLAEPGSLPAPPAHLVVGDPAGMLRRRPDIRAAERRLAADTAAIGVATADLFPKVSLIGNLGFAVDGLGRINAANAISYAAGPSLSWSLLDRRRIRAGIAAADARRDEALAQYDGVVLAALEDAETALSRYNGLMAAVAGRERALASADHVTVLADDRFREGVASSLETLDAARERLAAEQQLLAARTGLASAFVTVQKSLGLGFQLAPAAARSDGKPGHSPGA